MRGEERRAAFSGSGRKVYGDYAVNSDGRVKRASTAVSDKLLLDPVSSAVPSAVSFHGAIFTPGEMKSSKRATVSELSRSRFSTIVTPFIYDQFPRSRSVVPVVPVVTRCFRRRGGEETERKGREGSDVKVSTASPPSSPPGTVRPFDVANDSAPTETNDLSTSRPRRYRRQSKFVTFGSRGQELRATLYFQLERRGGGGKGDPMAGCQRLYQRDPKNSEAEPEGPVELRRRALLARHIKRPGPCYARLARDRGRATLNPARLRFRVFEISISERATRVN